MTSADVQQIIELLTRLTRKVEDLDRKITEVERLVRSTRNSVRSQ